MKPNILKICIAMLLAGAILLACVPQEEALPTAAPTPEIGEAPEVAVVVTATETPAQIATVPPTPSPSPTPEPTEPPTPSPTPKPLEGIVIGIDPGHQRVYNPHPEPVAPGSSQTKQKVAGGCRGVKSGVYEYEVVLNVGLYLKALLEEQGATVVITHDTLDVDISNIERAQFFNDNNVDLGIRLHCNKSGDKKVKGAFMLIPTENRTDFYTFNRRAAEIVLEEYLRETGLSIRYKTGITERGDQTGFNWCKRPIINIEMGHLSNPDDDALLSDDAFQQRMAQGLCNGIVRFFVEEGTVN